ncbi:19463_t:CDS:2, partial [Dentiscutata erythropus]
MRCIIPDVQNRYVVEEVNNWVSVAKSCQKGIAKCSRDARDCVKVNCGGYVGLGEYDDIINANIISNIR